MKGNKRDTITKKVEKGQKRKGQYQYIPLYISKVNTTPYEYIKMYFSLCKRSILSVT